MTAPKEIILKAKPCKEGIAFTLARVKQRPKYNFTSRGQQFSIVTVQRVSQVIDGFGKEVRSRVMHTMSYLLCKGKVCTMELIIRTARVKSVRKLKINEFATACKQCVEELEEERIKDIDTFLSEAKTIEQQYKSI